MTYYYSYDDHHNVFCMQGTDHTHVFLRNKVCIRMCIAEGI